MLYDVMVVVDFVVVMVFGGVKMMKLIDVVVLVVMKLILIFVNIVWGEVVDECVLIDILVVGKIVGVGLDVYENELYVFEDLRVFDNCVLLLYFGLVIVEMWFVMV